MPGINKDIVSANRAKQDQLLLARRLGIDALLHPGVSRGNMSQQNLVQKLCETDK